VIDTNTLVSAAILYGSVPWRAVTHALEVGVVLISESTWLELVAVLSRPKFDRYRANAQWEAFLRAIREHFEPVRTWSRIEACRHPNDDKFLELAIDGRADMIISGDQDLLVLHPFRGIELLTPAQFLERMAR
jgi:putative PIN family toxin of toxin-antitoxin system